MILSNFIARKYFFSKNVKRFVNYISGISMLGVCVATMALVIILSVFNGLNSLIRQQYHRYNPEIKILPAKGKTFDYNLSTKQKLQKLQDIESIVEVIEDDAVFKFRDAQMIGRIKGVSDNFIQQSGLSKSIRYGSFQLHQDGGDRANVSIGVAHTLSLNLAESMYLLEVWYPERKGKITLSEKDIRRNKIKPIGIYSMDELEHDLRYIIVPISFTQKLMDYGPERSALEVKAKDAERIDDLRDEIQKILGPSFVVQNRDQQQASVLRALKIEKFFVFLVLSFVLLIASLNIFFSLSMLALEKKKDIAIMEAMGASKSLIKMIFLKEGAMITLIGAVVGLILGVGIVLVQQYTGIVQMGTTTSVVDAYPVELHWTDLLITTTTIFTIAFLISIIPAQRASQTDLKDQL